MTEQSWWAILSLLAAPTLGFLGGLGGAWVQGRSLLKRDALNRQHEEIRNRIEFERGRLAQWNDAIRATRDVANVAFQLSLNPPDPERADPHSPGIPAKDRSELEDRFWKGQKDVHDRMVELRLGGSSTTRGLATAIRVDTAFLREAMKRYDRSGLAKRAGVMKERTEHLLTAVNQMLGYED